MKKGYWFGLSFIVLCLDQLSKYWAATTLIPYQPKPLLPMLNFTLAFNTGAAFSFLSGAGDWHHWFFTCFSLVISLVLIRWIISLPSDAKLQAFALSLLLGGAVGNLLDRALLGHVVDFIDVFYQNHHWPVFNIADTAICLGAFLLLIDLGKNSSTKVL